MRSEKGNPPIIDQANMAMVMAEIERARANHGPFNSAHEGFAVIMEELNELWTEVCKKRSTRSQRRMYAEAKQVAAMAIRFMTDICELRNDQQA